MLASTTSLRSTVDFSQRPMLVFWETTRACLLACRHCRASATTQPPPGELSTAEGRALIDQVAGFGRPYPILVLTGGDCLLRPDLFQLVDYAVSLGIPVCLSPSVTPLLDAAMIERIARSGIRAVSVSLDGCQARTHDGVRGIAGHFENTATAIAQLAGAGITVQVNTTVMESNVDDLPGIAALMARAGAHIWEVFFLVQVGRGTAAAPLAAAGHEDVCHFLYDASAYGFIVRTVEAPFFRRVVRARRAGAAAPDSALYRSLAGRLTGLLGPGTGRPSAHTAPTRDGKGIVFVAHDGQVYPAGFLPLGLGSIRTRPLREIYRDDPLLRSIRAARFTGRCGYCEYADLCGGSRARAYAATGDPLGEDPACPYQPGARLYLEVVVVASLTILVNPAAGGGRAIRHLPAVRTVLDAAGARYLIYQSSSLGHARALAAEAAVRGDLVVAIGGDGMAGAVASAIAQAKPGGDGVFGVIAAGRGNDLARTYGIPPGPADAARLLLAGEFQPMDLVALAGADGTQVTVAGSVYLGIASAAGQIANDTRLIRGPLVYPVAALRALASWKPVTFGVDATSATSTAGTVAAPQEFAGYGVVVANLPYFGAGMKVAPEADPGDGALDIVLMRHAPKLTFLRVLTKIRKGAHVGLDQVDTGRATAVTVTFDRPLRVGADGELFHVLPPLRISVLPGALCVIAPRAVRECPAMP